MQPVVLTTERLVLEVPTLDDVDRIVEYCRDPLFERWLTTPWPYEWHHATGWVKGLVPGWHEDRELTWALRTESGGELLGVVGVTLGTPDRPAGMIGFWLGGPHRGFGYMPEAARAAIDWVFAQGLLDEILWEAVVPNRASLIVARKLGFTYTGTRQADIVGRDGDRPSSWHAVLGRDDDRGVKAGWPE
ncbi:GNAT family N-acetyltransferase [Schumannella luteola]|uniref:RimJ/RimL family protein N-acetyltransferase n=1 Tax=Schumannella luteola TaxID=472059 RepID=A0A852Y9Y3_9MICO|nr:RimJ/RimL family protein N-acetyltransferase [Schumannella luteola]TPW91169.1 GNAT family N-acetyltransferase [Schumannella luteola]